MKLIRSSKCSTKFATASKKAQLREVLAEYGKVCNIFIEYFWNNGLVDKNALLKDIVDIPKEKTWLSARLRKVAARESIDMVLAMRERWKNEPKKMAMPVHRGKRMNVSCTIGELQDSKTIEYDAWLHLQSIGNKVNIDIPIRFHKHFNKLCYLGKRLNAYIITDSYVQFSFEIVTEEKKKGDKWIGVDTGINALASLSNGQQIGTDIKDGIERVKRCKQGSNGQQKARRALKQRIDEVAKELISLSPDGIVVERLKNMGKNSKKNLKKKNFKRRLNKNIRRSIGTWNWRYWLNRVEMACEINRVSFRTVAPFYTSQTCSICGHVDRMNRNGEVFLCLQCGHKENADVQASKIILNRFITGAHGPGCKA